MFCTMILSYLDLIDMIFKKITKPTFKNYFAARPSKLPNYLLERIDKLNSFFDTLDEYREEGRSFPIELNLEFHGEVEKFKKDVIAFSKEAQIHLKPKVADKFVVHTSSFLRSGLLIDLKECLEYEQWLNLFFQHWPSIEIGDELIEDLRETFSDANYPELMQKYGTSISRKVYEKLPDEITVFRGCSTNSLNGLSWTADTQMAKFFAQRRLELFTKNSMMKLRIMSDIRDEKEMEKFINLPFEDTFILKGVVKKSDCFLFSDRKENEFFSTKVKLVDSYLIKNRTDLIALNI